jgi:hypothetical protein
MAVVESSTAETVTGRAQNIADISSLTIRCIKNVAWTNRRTHKAVHKEIVAQTNRFGQNVAISCSE